MKKRRIEVTRERWTRIRIESHAPVICPLCHGAADLSFLPAAPERTGVSQEDVNRAIRSGLLPVWEAQTGEALVCLDCLRKLKEEKTI
jgi:hypothetical protein